MQDATSRYRLLECVGRSDKGETWQAFDNLTQRVVAVTVVVSGGGAVTVVEDDGGVTVAKDIPPAAGGSAPVLDYPAYGPQSDSLVEYRAYWSGTPVPSSPTGEGQQQDDQKSAGPKKSRKRRLIVLSSVAVVAVIAVVAAIVLIDTSQHGGTTQASSAMVVPAPPADTGPLTGTFTVHMDQAYLGGGDPDTEVEAKPWTEPWQFRSACSANGCVATATGGDHADVSSMVFDSVGGRWLEVGLSHIDCGNPNDEAWNVISLAPQPDGTLSGESTRASAGGCFMKRNVTFTRKGDADISQLPDPTHLDPRVVSPAEALHGRYDFQTTYADGYKTGVNNYGVRTDCLRTGDRCMSFFLAPGGSYEPYVFANGTWTLNEESPHVHCSSGGTFSTTYTATMALPQQPQNPITSLIAHGYDNVSPGSGVRCPRQAYDETYTRTGD
ncbi:hypothetical protein [Mycobacterium sp. Aquia_213]|uniref:hypothetical protein n=1 Tax=Mycobacterium sp. Aquia_213 TaxID=2991728 RepID=UPI00227088E9|nr:hypothetical protein [Mycobacterium sp. Aquia_213]WAC91777.1 hypothetical protein LMQ14_00645 [Mycobacterium sp. Aquia_213]